MTRRPTKGRRARDVVGALGSEGYMTVTLPTKRAKVPTKGRKAKYRRTQSSRASLIRMIRKLVNENRRLTQQIPGNDSGVWLIQSRIKGSNGPWTTTATLAFDSEHAQNLLRHARANYPGIEYRPRKFVEVQPALERDLAAIASPPDSPMQLLVNALRDPRWATESTEMAREIADRARKEVDAYLAHPQIPAAIAKEQQSLVDGTKGETP